MRTFRTFRPRAPKYSYLLSTNPSKSTVGSASSSYLYGKSDLSSTSSMANLPLATTSAASGISSQYDTLGRSHKYDDMEIYSTFRWDTMRHKELSIIICSLEHVAQKLFRITQLSARLGH